MSDRLNEASTRISAVGRAYERLAYNADYENIDLVSYLREVIDDLEMAVAPCKVQLEAPDEIQFAADRAILVALVINELVLNAGKYAYPNSSDGLIWVRLARMGKDSFNYLFVMKALACRLGLTRERVSVSARVWSTHWRNSWEPN